MNRDLDVGKPPCPIALEVFEIVKNLVIEMGLFGPMVITI
jgi:hypothetical protein